MAKPSPSPTAALQHVFIALLIDILAFTIILPLFPRILNEYKITEGSNTLSWFYYFLSHIHSFKSFLGAKSDFDIVLFGGAIGSMFSFLQFISSPLVGHLSDIYGRRAVLLASMFGNALSMGLWIFSKSFPIFLLSRIIGGLTEGNVQMSIAMISDVTTTETRSKGLALVGIAFACGFTVGPPLGALFASIDLPTYFPSLSGLPIHSLSAPALFAFALIILETFYLYFYLPETNNFQKEKVLDTKRNDTITAKPSNTSIGKSAYTVAAMHFLYLFFFSGMEFTLTFLTYDRFDFTHIEQGKLLGFIGVLSALVQGGYVRRVAHKSVHERQLVIQGVISCSIGLAIIASVAFFTTQKAYLYLGAAFLAFTSGTVVSSLTAIATFEASATSGKSLGLFRALGQLGRSLGPIFSCIIYWVYGAVSCYAVGSISMALVALIMMARLPSVGQWTPAPALLKQKGAKKDN